MENKVFAYIQQYHMIEKGDRVVAGVSGGADSVCLLSVLREYQERIPFALGVVHVNHHLRGEEADRDAGYVRSLCRKWQLEYREFDYQVDQMAAQYHLSQEEAGRKARYQAFELFRKEWKGNKVALAHHQNDVAETFLYHLARGSGIRGLCGIRPVRDEIIRPLLGIQRCEIEHYLEEKGIDYLTDSTNLSLEYTRNKIRRQILPALTRDINVQTVPHIAKAAEVLLETEIYLEKQAKPLLEEYVTQEKGRLRIDSKLFQEEGIMQKYVLQRVLEMAAGSLKDIGAEHLASLMELPSRGVGKEAVLPYGLRGQMGYREMWIYRADSRDRGKEAGESRLTCHWDKFPYEKQAIPEKKYTKWIDYDKIVLGLELRTRRSGDYLVVNASGGRKKLKDYLIDCKVPRDQRDELLLLADGSHIVWAVGYRISEYYKITSKTKTVLEVRLEGGKKYE